MAAIDLERGLEHSGRNWGKERLELMDNFDSEMQEWEDQLQDIQRKIEELYTEVQARRGGSDIATGNMKNGSQLECGHHGNGLFTPALNSKSHAGAIAVPNHYGSGCNYGTNGYNYATSHQSSYGYSPTDGVSEIGDLLQDYLGQEKQASRKNNGARHVRFSEIIKVSQDTPGCQDDILKRSGNVRFGQEQFLGSPEQNENRKNRVSHMKSCPNKENTGSKPPLGQKDTAAFQSRSTSQLPGAASESPAQDRKCLSPGVLGDKKCSSPSILRKFGAMLQENEGKLLTDSGVVTQQAPESKCPTPVCQRRACVPSPVNGRCVQKCRADSDVLTPEMEPSQEWGSMVDSGRKIHKDLRGSHSIGSPTSPQLSQRRAQVAGSPKIRSRANSMSERDGGQAQGERARKPASHHGEPKMDYRASSTSYGAQKIQRAGLASQSELPHCSRDEDLIELLDMLEIQHEYTSSPRTVYRQEPQQVNPVQLSPKPKESFSRPARPANQRPPSRWASRTTPAIIKTPSGPRYQPPSPLTYSPSQMTRTPSPATKQRPTVSYSFQTETVIM